MLSPRGRVFAAVDILVVTTPGRPASLVADIVATVSTEEEGRGLRIIPMNLDTSTPTGKLMVNQAGSIAEFKRKSVLARRRSSAKRGCVNVLLTVSAHIAQARQN
jgi:DNA invertase Pin-like site-specific DNA recombinase